MRPSGSSCRSRRDGSCTASAIASLITAVYAAGMAVDPARGEAVLRPPVPQPRLARAGRARAGHGHVADRLALPLVLGDPLAGRIRADAPRRRGPLRPAVADRLPRPLRAFARRWPSASCSRGWPASDSPARWDSSRPSSWSTAPSRSIRPSGIVVVAAAALNGIAVVRAYLHLFTGGRHVSTVWLGIGARERIAVLTLAAMILGGGLFPQPGVTTRERAAEEILTEPHQTAGRRGSRLRDGPDRRGGRAPADPRRRAGRIGRGGTLPRGPSGYPPLTAGAGTARHRRCPRPSDRGMPYHGATAAAPQVTQHSPTRWEDLPDEVAHRIPDLQRAGPDGLRQHHSPGRGDRPQERRAGGPGALQRHAHHGQRVHQRRRARPARGLQEVAGAARSVRRVARSATSTTGPARTTPTPTTSGRSWAARSSWRSPRGSSTSGPWEQIFYGEFDGRRPKRVLVKVIGE